MSIGIQKLRASVCAYMKDHSFPGHDWAHLQRVHVLCVRLADLEEGNVDREILEASALLHDIARDLERKDASVDHAAAGADIAEELLKASGFPSEKIAAVCDAVRTHRYSTGKTPSTKEGCLLQDADRLDACGAVGVAAAFSFGGAHGRSWYHPDDPFAEARPLDDKAYTLDHFYTKLLKLSDALHTDTARQLAEERSAFLLDFLAQFRRELEVV